MSTTPFPNEIQDAVIDQLRTDTKYLSHCSLVSKQWLTRCRYWSYTHRQAKLIARSDMPADFEEKRDARRFIELLHAPHSTLAPYILCLLINGPDFGHEAFDVAGPKSDYDILNTLISESLPLLRNLRTITIASVTWHCLQPEARAAIASLPLVTSISWESIVFERLADLLGFCSTNFAGLQKLKIRQIQTVQPETHQDHDISRTGHNFPRLRLLDVVARGATRHLLSVPSVYIQPQNVETLCLGGVSIDDFTLVGRFIEAAGPGLRHVALDIARSATEAETSQHVNFISSISFHRNSNLQCLEISTFVLHPSVPSNTAWLQAIVTTIMSPRFEEMTLWLNVASKEWNGGFFDFQSLEQSLVQRTEPPMVHVKLITPGGNDAYETRLVAIIESQVPVLHERKLLVVYPGAPPSKVFDGWWPYVW